MPAVTERIGNHALARVLGERSHKVKRATHQFYKAESTPGAMLMDLPLEEPSVDEGEMAVHNVVISTPAVDRVADVLIPTGFVPDRYKANPQILWDHGFSNEDGGSMSIAMCEDKAHNLAITADEHSVVASAYFHGKTPLSQQVFSLVACKGIRAASVRPEPIETDLVVDDETDRIGILMLKWGIAEWSFVAIGCNQEALVKALRDKRLDGEKLAAPLLKSFGHLAIKPAKGKGMTLDASKTSSEDEDKTKSDEPEGDPVEHDEPQGDKKPAGDEAVSQETQMKYGAQYLSALHNGVGQLVAVAKQGMGALENESVIEVVTAAIASLEDLLAGIEGTYGGQYADMPALGKADESSEDEEAQCEALKSFLKSGILVNSQFTGFAGRLKRLLGAKNLTGPQKLELESTLKGMERLQEQAKSHEDSELAKKVKSLTDRVAAMQKRVNDGTPHLHLVKAQ